HRGPAHRGDLLARWPRPPGLRGRHQPRLSHHVRDALHLHLGGARAEPRERPHVRGHRPPHRLRHPRSVTPLLRPRPHHFRANRRGFWSLWIFVAMFGISLGSELIANDRPIVIRYDGSWYFPIVKAYPETTFGGVFPTETVYRAPAVIKLIQEKGWMIWPPI